ncbi:DUF6115 domain-containing protein [Salisediminibacterium selenitireducens]|uniref:Uncharacterized protein n=1 Tax=Bacillus selenitireducens (strain ATCC 700615 / DSM 15326 / MLS10) TaxID=439292 RepID=D6XTZ4_BACIE|nr:hypothetical protein [Salisediminibacterium selenitireducens]ADH99280.1 hypothetical protein Bsel_1773 [[Bacillus] selenitireducens MLS10]
MIYLLIVSFFLHLTSIFAIVVLYQKTEAVKPPDHSQTLREMEDLLISYTTEMKENNERMARRLSKLNTEQVAVTRVDRSLYDQGETFEPNQKRHPFDSEKKDVSFGDEKRAEAMEYEQKSHGYEDVRPDQDEDYGDYVPPGVNDEEVQVDTSSTSRILSLYAQGYTIQEIAKQLQMGAGEVELLLKFHQ